MSDRHFDLNAALQDARAGDRPEPWTFDLGPNYVEPPGDGDTRSIEDRTQPWRITPDLSGLAFMEYMAAKTVSGNLAAAYELLRTSIDPLQWEQFRQVLMGPPPVPMSVIDRLISQISRVSVGLPLDR